MPEFGSVSDVVLVRTDPGKNWQELRSNRILLVRTDFLTHRFCFYSILHDHELGQKHFQREWVAEQLGRTIIKF